MRSGRWLFSGPVQIVAAVLAVVTVLGVGVALNHTTPRRPASQEATVARATTEAVRLGELASNQENPSVALALAAEALAVDDSRGGALPRVGHPRQLLGPAHHRCSPRWGGRGVVEGYVAGRPDDGNGPRCCHRCDVDGRTRHRPRDSDRQPTAMAFSPDGATWPRA